MFTVSPEKASGTTFEFCYYMSPNKPEMELIFEASWIIVNADIC